MQRKLKKVLAIAADHARPWVIDSLVLVQAYATMMSEGPETAYHLCADHIKMHITLSTLMGTAPRPNIPTAFALGIPGFAVDNGGKPKTRRDTQTEQGYYQPQFLYLLGLGDRSC